MQGRNGDAANGGEASKALSAGHFRLTQCIMRARVDTYKHSVCEYFNIRQYDTVLPVAGPERSYYYYLGTTCSGYQGTSSGCYAASAGTTTRTRMLPWAFSS